MYVVWAQPLRTRHSLVASLLWSVSPLLECGLTGACVFVCEWLQSVLLAYTQQYKDAGWYAQKRMNEIQLFQDHTQHDVKSHSPTLFLFVNNGLAVSQQLCHICPHSYVSEFGRTIVLLAVSFESGSEPILRRKF